MKKNIDMKLTVEGLGETLKVINGSLFVGNENSTNHTSIYLEDISQVQNKELVSKLEELHKIVLGALTEIKELSIESYKNEWMVEGEVDENVENGVKGVA